MCSFRTDSQRSTEKWRVLWQVPPRAIRRSGCVSATPGSTCRSRTSGDMRRRTRRRAAAPSSKAKRDGTAQCGEGRAERAGAEEYERHGADTTRRCHTGRQHGGEGGLHSRDPPNSAITGHTGLSCSRACSQSSRWVRSVLRNACISLSRASTSASRLFRRSRTLRHR